MSVFQEGSKALITGGASGIGLAVAQLCLKHEMRVTIVDFNDTSLNIAKKSLRGEVVCILADVSQEGEWKKIREEVGDVDFLMLNAGVGGKGSWGDNQYFHKVSASHEKRGHKGAFGRMHSIGGGRYVIGRPETCEFLHLSTASATHMVFYHCKRLHHPILVFLSYTRHSQGLACPSRFGSILCLVTTPRDSVNIHFSKF